MKDVVIRFATKHDFVELYELSDRYYQESMFAKQGMKYDADCLIHTLISAIEGKPGAVVAVADGDIVGMVLMSVTHVLFKSGDLGVDVFYVAPEWRGTRCGNALQDAVMQIIKRNGYACAYEGSTSGFGHRTERQFTNMLTKRGFIETGPACVYLNPECEEIGT